MTWSINWDKASVFGFSNPHRAYIDGLDRSPLLRQDSTVLNQKIEASIFPNPIKDNILSLSLKGMSSNVDFRFQAFTLNGISVLNEVRTQTGSLEHMFDVSILKMGLYFYTISFGNQKIQGKFIKQ
ncbi:T9SS type A sorting domain-containing protein [Aquimarina intermedia]|nr:T9SS type A sorting domain-containing protein [Aquimarina intermedia]